MICKKNPLVFIYCFFIVPQFKSVNVTATNGTIDVRWLFRHTGGLQINDVDIYCQISEEGSGSRITDSLSCASNGCVNENLMGGATLSPVLAGENYYCSITAINSEGTDMRTSNDIAITEGLTDCNVTLLPFVIFLLL